MSRFVRLSEGHYINLDLVTDVVLGSIGNLWYLRFLFCVPDGNGDDDGDQISSETTYKSEAEAKAELARILPESVQPTSNRLPKIMGDGIPAGATIIPTTPEMVASIKAAIGAQYLKPQNCESIVDNSSKEI